MVGFVYPFYGIYVLQKLSEVGLWIFIFLAFAEITKIYRLLQDFIENGEQCNGSMVIRASDWVLFMYWNNISYLKLVRYTPTTAFFFSAWPGHLARLALAK